MKDLSKTQDFSGLSFDAILLIAERMPRMPLWRPSVGRQGPVYDMDRHDIDQMRTGVPGAFCGQCSECCIGCLREKYAPHLEAMTRTTRERALAEIAQVTFPGKDRLFPPRHQSRVMWWVVVLAMATAIGAGLVT